MSLPKLLIPPVIIPLPDGSYQVKPGRPVTAPAWITTRQAAQLLGISQRRVQALIQAGLIRARRPGGPRGNYRIELAALGELAGSEATAPPRRD